MVLERSSPAESCVLNWGGEQGFSSGMLKVLVAVTGRVPAVSLCESFLSVGAVVVLHITSESA